MIYPLPISSDNPGLEPRMQKEHAGNVRACLASGMRATLEVQEAVYHRGTHAGAQLGFIRDQLDNPGTRT